MKSVNLELKNIKYAAFNSHETDCFEATIYKDGKRWCFASNDGRGGETMLYALNDGSPSELRREIETINAGLGEKTEKISGKNYTFKLTVEMLVNNLLTEHLIEKDIKSLLKRRICFVKNGAVHELAAKFKPTKETINAVLNSDFWKSGDYILLNGLPLTEVRKYWG